MSDKEDAPVVGDENFVNVDPDFANWSNEVDRPLPLPEVEDHNLPPEFREDKKEKEEKEDEEKADPKKEVSRPVVNPTPAKPQTPAPTTK